MSVVRALLRGRLVSMASSVQFQKRHLGVLDSVTNMATNAISGTKEKQFEKMLEQMMATEPKNWTLRPWKKTMEDQLNGWIMYVPGVSSSSEVKEIKHFKLMLDVMTDAELDRPHEINGQARERIAKASGRGADEVARLVFFYRQSLILCTWLQAKKTAGEEMPKTEAEMHLMSENDQRMRNIAMKVMNPKGAKKQSGRGRKTPF